LKIIKKKNRRQYCKGILVSFLLDDGNKKCVIIGHSLCNSTDTFNHQVAYEIAIARGLKRFTSSTYDVPPSIDPEWLTMMRKVSAYYKGELIFPAWFVKE
jgi:hypothetical protein